MLTLLKAAGGEQEGASWDQGELAETLWAEMGLQPDAHITHVCTAKIAVRRLVVMHTHACFVASGAEDFCWSCQADKPKRGAHYTRNVCKAASSAFDCSACG